jgi:hypothetical protein
MARRIQVQITAMAVTCCVWSSAPAGVITAVTAGNMLFIPLKAISFSMGAFSGALSFVLTGGDEEVMRQVWRDTLQGPYVITPELAKKAIGERPELNVK